jgi:hypothetical protein
MYSRRPKESHRDTITYEIDMLDFCARAVTGREHPSECDMFVYLEAFLHHYGNLIRFFSGEHHRPDDLSMGVGRQIALSSNAICCTKISPSFSVG